MKAATIMDRTDCHDRQEGMTLVELLIGMTIATVLTTMILISWFSLQDSYSYSVRSSKARDNSREAMARMAREIRDAQGRVGQMAILTAQPDRIVFTTTFNDPGTLGNGRCLLTQYWLEGSTVKWQRDTNNNQALDNSDRTRVLLSNVVNSTVPTTANPTHLFTYTYIGEDGAVHQTHDMGDPSLILSVRIQLLVDLNPGSSPVYFDLATTVQPRNLRQT